jgi:hypothetical protein
MGRNPYLLTRMKKPNFITLLATVIAMVGITSAGFAATKPVASSKGSVSLKPVKDENGVFDVTIAVTAQTQENGAPLSNLVPNVSANNPDKKLTQARISNKEILASITPALPDGGKGYKLQWVRPWGTTLGYLRAYNTKTGDKKPVPTSHLVVAWLGDANVSPAVAAFDKSVFKGVASLTASPSGGSAPYSYVVTPTVGVKKPGVIDGITYYELTLFDNTAKQIDASGYGSFKDEVKGFSGKANLSGYGAGATPAP